MKGVEANPLTCSPKTAGPRISKLSQPAEPPSPAEIAQAFVDIPTDPGVAAPAAPARTPAPVAQEDPAAEGVPWWVPALGLAVLVTLAVVVFTSLR